MANLSSAAALYGMRDPFIQNSDLLEERSPLDPSNLNFGAIICLADRERKQTEGVSGQHRITRGKVI
jgi:hypothetical protein